jgi:hypothetical protein
LFGFRGCSSGVNRVNIVEQPANNSAGNTSRNFFKFIMSVLQNALGL